MSDLERMRSSIALAESIPWAIAATVITGMICFTTMVITWNVKWVIDDFLSTVRLNGWPHAPRTGEDREDA